MRELLFTSSAFQLSYATNITCSAVSMHSRKMLAEVVLTMTTTTMLLLLFLPLLMNQLGFVPGVFLSEIELIL